MSSSDLKKICFANPICWMFTLLTALVITNIVFSAVTFLSMRQLKNDVLDIQKQQTVASEIKEQMSDMLSESREKRSALSSTSSSRLAVDVGSVFISAIKSMCKPEGAVCIPGVKEKLDNREEMGWRGEMELDFQVEMESQVETACLVQQVLLAEMVLWVYLVHLVSLELGEWDCLASKVQ